jgi:hypothetical protein
MLTDQNGKCSICNGLDTANKRLAVDHCHETGKIRGLLCGSCNRGIGLLKDCHETLKKASEYIFTHKKEFYEK